MSLIGANNVSLSPANVLCTIPHGCANVAIQPIGPIGELVAPPVFGNVVYLTDVDYEVYTTTDVLQPCTGNVDCRAIHDYIECGNVDCVLTHVYVPGVRFEGNLVTREGNVFIINEKFDFICHGFHEAVGEYVTHHGNVFVYTPVVPTPTYERTIEYDMYATETIHMPCTGNVICGGLHSYVECNGNVECPWPHYTYHYCVPMFPPPYLGGNVVYGNVVMDIHCDGYDFERSFIDHHVVDTVTTAQTIDAFQYRTNDGVVTQAVGSVLPGHILALQRSAESGNLYNDVINNLVW